MRGNIAAIVLILAGGFMLLATAVLYTLCIRLLVSGRGMRQ